MAFLAKFLYFSAWFILSVVFTALTALNLDWEFTPIWQGIVIVIILGFLQSSVSEFLVMSIAAIIVRKSDKVVGDGSAYHCIINYNLLAMSEDDINEAFEKMHHAYILNLGANVAAVLVSATKQSSLRDHEIHVRDEYRKKIYNTLMLEGCSMAKGEYSAVTAWRLHNFWLRRYQSQSRRLFINNLPSLCRHYAEHFMCIHRVSKVLKKCGQYQDLMLLSQGENSAWTYTDNALYSRRARPYNEPLFALNDDVQNIMGKKFNYTMVLDGDTLVPPGAIHDLLDVAAANPEVAILQPRIKLEAGKSDTLYMRLEHIRQQVLTPVTEAMSIVLDQCGYYGKALINNELYIKHVIGTREDPIERVPIDVLSHDTFEAAVLKPMYVGNVALCEAPSYNYVTWHIRELRWNKGEILLAMYFWPKFIGLPMRFLQRCFQGENWITNQVRVVTKSDFITGYVTHNALRIMFMKPMLLAFIFLHFGARFHYPYHAIGLVMFFVAIFPKLAVMRHHNILLCCIDLIAGIIQFTPESIVGCVRLVRAIVSNITQHTKWTPQRVVEEQFRQSNPFLSSLKHLWGYSLVSGIGIVLVAVFEPQYFLMFFMLGSVFLLPFFTGITSLTSQFCTAVQVQTQPATAVAAHHPLLSNSQNTNISSVVAVGR